MKPSATANTSTVMRTRAVRVSIRAKTDSLERLIAQYFCILRRNENSHQLKTVVQPNEPVARFAVQAEFRKLALNPADVYFFPREVLDVDQQGTALPRHERSELSLS